MQNVFSIAPELLGRLINYATLGLLLGGIIIGRLVSIYVAVACNVYKNNTRYVTRFNKVEKSLFLIFYNRSLVMRIILVVVYSRQTMLAQVYVASNFPERKKLFNMKTLLKNYDVFVAYVSLKQQKLIVSLDVTNICHQTADKSVILITTIYVTNLAKKN